MDGLVEVAVLDGKVNVRIRAAHGRVLTYGIPATTSRRPLARAFGS